MTSRGFTLLELMITTAIAMTLLAIAVPKYKQSRETQTLQAAAYFLENKMHECKLRAVTESGESGFCLGDDSIREYWHPQLFYCCTARPQFFDPVSLSQLFAIPIHLSVANNSVDPNGRVQNPCSSKEAVIPMIDDTVRNWDWQGTITLESGEAQWHLAVLPGGVFHNGP